MAYVLSASRLVGARSVGTSLARCLIRDHLPTIYRYLNHGKQIVIQSALRLLVSLVMHGPSTTRELFDAFNFQLKPLAGFLRIRRKQSEPNGNSIQDIRTLYVKFLLGFLIRGDSNVKKSILETKNLLGFIVKDMKNDPFESVQFVLDTLQRVVIDDARLPRSTKVAFFHIAILQQLLSIYSCDDLSNPRYVNSNIPSESIADITHLFMKSMCMIPGQGICFRDSGWYPKSQDGSAQLNNPLLGKLISNLKVSDDLRQRELFLGIIDACPELVSFFWVNCGHLSFEPRSSMHYISNIALGTSVINLDIPISFGLKLDEETIPSPPPVSICIANILPPMLNRQISSKALQFSSRDVRFACGKQLASSFLKLQKVLDVSYEMIRTIKSNFHVGDQAFENWVEWEKNLLFEFRINLPDPQIIIALSKSAQQIPSDEDGLTIEDLSLSHLELLKYYQIYNNGAMKESRYDFGKLLSSELIGFSSTIKVALFDVLLAADNFKWHNKFEGNSTYLGLLLNIFCIEKDTFVRQKLSQLLVSFASSTFAFQGHIDVIEMFWDAAASSSPEILGFVEDLLVNHAKSPFKLIDHTSATAKRINCLDEELLVPPMFLAFFEDLSAKPIHYHIFLADLIVKHCCKKDLNICRLYKLLIENCMPDWEQSSVFRLLMNWLLFLSGQNSKMAGKIMN